MSRSDASRASGGSEARVCPRCGTSNSGLSLFCAECGTALFDTPGEDETQTTAIFTPSPGPRATEDATQETMASAPVWSPQPRDTGWPTPLAPPRPESRRGLVLGWIASILIALVVGFAIWATLLSADTREMITGWFI